MISYSKYKLLKEADVATPPPAAGAGAGAATPAAPTGDLGSSPDLGGGGPPPGFSGGPPMGMGGPPGGGPSMDLGSLGSPSATGAAGMKPQGLKSNNVWDVLERILGGNSKEDEDKKQKEDEEQDQNNTGI